MQLYKVARDTPDSDNDVMCTELKKDEGWKKSVNNSRPVSIASEPDRNDSKWIDIVSGKYVMRKRYMASISKYYLKCVSNANCIFFRAKI